MGNSSKNSSKKEITYELACEDCITHFLLEIISYEDIILIKKYCFCGEITLSVNSHVLDRMIINTKYYQVLNYAVIPDTKINKFCYQCKKFISNEESLNHGHKAIINAADYIYNCKLHKSKLIIGFCKECKKLICEICINLHKNHEIEYTKDLEITEETLNKYETNLEKAFFEMNNLAKIKYGDDYENIEMQNLFEEMEDFEFYDKKDQQIIKTLELLKTFLDLYKNHKKNNQIINYIIISNILKHMNFEILRIRDNKTFKNQDKLNEYINIFLKIELKIDKNTDNIFKIISFKEIKLNKFLTIEKLLIKIIKGAIYFFLFTRGNRIILYT